MTSRAAWLGSAVFLLLAPGIVAGVVPWLLTDWAPGARSVPATVLGVVMAVSGMAVVVHAFVLFVVRGRGTPAPVAPTRRLVAAGPYRHVRNPMYLAVTTCVLGQALALGRPILLGYGALLFLLMAAFARFHEEPSLRRQFGDDYTAYRAAVPAWLPRWRQPRAGPRTTTGSGSRPESRLRTGEPGWRRGRGHAGPRP